MSHHSMRVSITAFYACGSLNPHRAVMHLSQRRSLMGMSCDSLLGTGALCIVLGHCMHTRSNTLNAMAL